MKSRLVRSLPVLVFLLAIFSPVSTGEITLAAGLQSTSCETAAPGGRLLLRPVSTVGTQLRGLIVLDPASGVRVGEIDIPLVDVAFSTALPGIALAVSGSELYLVDTAEMDATLIDLGEGTATDLSPNPVQFRGTAGERYMLLGSPSFDQVYLIDLEDRDATDLTNLIPVPAPDSPVFLSFAAVSPDDASVIAWDGRHIYQFETDDPTVARPVDSGAFAFSPDFSPDGSELIYSTSDGPGSGSTLMLESIDGSESEVVRSSEHAQVTLWIPESRRVFIDERTEDGAAAGIAFVLDLDSGEETPLLSYSGSLTSVQLSPDGERALLSVEMMGSGAWSLADLVTGEVTELPQLSGGRALPGLYADATWSLIVPLGEGTDPLSGPSYRGVNLTTGDVGRLLEQPPGVSFVLQPLVSINGQHSLVIGEDESGQTLWLLDAGELRALELASGASISGQFSPDACHVGLTRERLVDGIPSFSVTVVSTSAEGIHTVLEEQSGVQLAAWVS